MLIDKRFERVSEDSTMLVKHINEFLSTHEISAMAIALALWTVDKNMGQQVDKWAECKKVGKKFFEENFNV